MDASERRTLASLAGYCVRVVDSLDQAIEHITKYGSGHSECIVTQDYAASEKFVAEIDAACVYVNASTRFTDSQGFGLRGLVCVIRVS